jgi:hypothetical protein
MLPEPKRTCKKHGEQPLAAYYVSTTKGDKPRTLYKCKACDKAKVKNHRKDNPEWWSEYGRKWRESHKELNDEYRRQHRLEAMTLVFSHLQTHPCVDCGEDNPLVLEFDHVKDSKLETISRMVQGRYSLAKIETEIAKCEVRCVKCHRLRTITQLGWYQYLSPELLKPAQTPGAKPEF